MQKYFLIFQMFCNFGFFFEEFALLDKILFEIDEVFGMKLLAKLLHSILKGIDVSGCGV